MSPRRKPSTHNAALTEVGRGKPMGELLRRYWHPIGLCADAHPGLHPGFQCGGSAAEPVVGKLCQILVNRLGKLHVFAFVRAAIGRAQHQGRMYVPGHAAHVGQIVIDEGHRRALDLALELPRFWLLEKDCGSKSRRRSQN